MDESVRVPLPQHPPTGHSVKPATGPGAADPAGAAPPPAAPGERHAAGRLADAHGRTIRDLRLSVTDRCNFRCVYCMDPDHRYMPKMELLGLEEYVRVVRAAARLGIDKLRLTGGEPTLYRDLDALIERVADLGLTDVAMTTNGSLMTETDAARWRSLGLTRLTLSLDSLRDERVRSITRARTDLASTIRAIEAAKAAGLGPVKVNAVVVRGRNDDEIADFADFARDHDVDVRLIEWMPLDSGHTWSRGAMVTAAEMLEAITARHRLEPADGDRPDSTSMNYRFADGGPGRIGLIASVTRPFCGACSRLRITADGKVRPCLFSTREWDLRPVLRDEEHAGDEAAADGAIRRFLIDAVWTKQAGHGIGAEDFEQPARGMSAIGG